MRRKKNTEKQKEANKKGSERMRRFKSRKESPEQNENLKCWTYWEKNVTAGDDDWNERFYYFDPNKKVDKPMK